MREPPLYDVCAALVDRGCMPIVYPVEGGYDLKAAVASGPFTARAMYNPDHQERLAFMITSIICLRGVSVG